MLQSFKQNHQPIQPLEISIPLHLNLSKQSYQLFVGERKYTLTIETNCKENDIVPGTINEGIHQRELPIRIKYKPNKYFKREDDTLIGSLKLSSSVDEI